MSLFWERGFIFELLPTGFFVESIIRPCSQIRPNGNFPGIHLARFLVENKFLDLNPRRCARSRARTTPVGFLLFFYY